MKSPLFVRQIGWIAYEATAVFVGHGASNPYGEPTGPLRDPLWSSGRPDGFPTRGRRNRRNRRNRKREGGKRDA